MPIANCYLSSEIDEPVPDNLLSLWQEFSRIDSREMTINTVTAAQMGKPYLITVHLLLPSLWSLAAIDRLQLGLAQALSRSFQLQDTEIIVLTQIIQSGRVVEAGHEVHW